MLNQSVIKKIVYGLAAICAVTIIYLAFVRKTANSTATSRNATFLDIKQGEKSEKTAENKAEDKKQDGAESKKEDQSTKKSDETNSSNGDNKTNAAPDNSQDKPAGFYTVKAGDTYGCIAEKYYGSYEHWVDILNANIKYGEGFEETRLFVDAKLEMPAISKANLKPSTKLCQ